VLVGGYHTQKGVNFVKNHSMKRWLTKLESCIENESFSFIFDYQK